MKNSATAHPEGDRAAGEVARTTAAARGARSAGIVGSVANCQAKVIAASGTTQKNAPRQPIYCAEEAAQRRGDGRRQRVAAVEDRQRARHLVLGHQPHDSGRRHRPEAADHHADERAAGHEDRGVRRERDHRARHQHQRGEPQQQRPAVDPRVADEMERLVEHREEAGDRDRLAGLPSLT